MEKVYGFEDYSFIRISDDYIDGQPHSWYYTYCGRPYNGTFIPADNFPIKDKGWGSFEFTRPICKDHKEILATANKVYVHPACGISRTVVGSKYKKSLNPWLADAVVVPNSTNKGLFLRKMALFVNEEHRYTVGVYIIDDNVNDRMKTVSLGTKLKDLLTEPIDDRFRLAEITIESELVYYGYMLFVPDRMGHIKDILMKVIPEDKIVLEESLQESLSSEENKITLENLLSIRDMIGSSDMDTVGAGLKALAAMDYMHYPNSIMYALDSIIDINWKYNPALNSTAVKFMRNQLYGSRRSRLYAHYRNNIHEEDYKLFRQLVAELKKIDEKEINNEIKYFDFITISDSGYLTPNLIVR